MQQLKTQPQVLNHGNVPQPIGFRYSCGLKGNNTGLSHYILLDKKN